MKMQQIKIWGTQLKQYLEGFIALNAVILLENSKSMI